jgi:hypothetical protein
VVMEPWGRPRIRKVLLTDQIANALLAARSFHQRYFFKERSLLPAIESACSVEVCMKVSINVHLREQDVDMLGCYRVG